MGIRTSPLSHVSAVSKEDIITKYFFKAKSKGDNTCRNILIPNFIFWYRALIHKSMEFWVSFDTFVSIYLCWSLHLHHDPAAVQRAHSGPHGQRTWEESSQSRGVSPRPDLIDNDEIDIKKKYIYMTCVGQIKAMNTSTYHCLRVRAPGRHSLQ